MRLAGVLYIPRYFSVYLLRTILGALRFEGMFFIVFLESLPGMGSVTICSCVAMPIFVVHQYVPFFATARICACVAVHPPTVCLDFVST